jgi:hypothetical protein
MYVPGMFDNRLLIVERCGVLIGVGVSAATVCKLLRYIVIFHATKKNYINKASYFPNPHYRENIQDTAVCCAILAPVSQVRAFAMLLIVIVENYK